jgi:hypothetical protein
MCGVIWLTMAGKTRLAPWLVRNQQRSEHRNSVVCRGVTFSACVPLRGFGASAELRSATISYVMSDRPHGTTGLPLDGFARYLIRGFFENLSRKFKRG